MADAEATADEALYARAHHGVMIGGVHGVAAVEELVQAHARLCRALRAERDALRVCRAQIEAQQRRLQAALGLVHGALYDEK